MPWILRTNTIKPEKILWKFRGKRFGCCIHHEKVPPKRHAKNSIKDIDQKIKDKEKQHKIPSRKKSKMVKPTTQFFSDKMLIFAKMLLESFNYCLTETFFLPGMIERIFPFSVLTDTDIFICKRESSLQDSKFRNNLFEVIKKRNLAQI